MALKYLPIIPILFSDDDCSLRRLQAIAYSIPDLKSANLSIISKG